ncbi:nuclear transport factor 2 family protein [Nostoc sp. 3335mG]|nr:nuclear transport factor 2 family protein [Nostoc sp. 3335mG]
MSGAGSVEARLQAIEDQLAIYQIVSAYGYAIDGCNAEVVGSLYAEDGVYAVGDMPAFKGRDRIAAITRDDGHLSLVGAGCAHVSTLPHVVIDGDRAVATCHTMLMQHRDGDFFVGRLSASRIELSRRAGGGWRIDHRQNYLQVGDGKGPALLARLKEPPPAIAR